MPGKQSPNGSHSTKQPYSEEYTQSRNPFFKQAPMLNEVKNEWPSIPDTCFVVRPLSMAPQHHSFNLLHSREYMSQIYHNSNRCRTFRRPSHFRGFASTSNHCEYTPVICWLGYMPKPKSSSVLDSSANLHVSQTKWYCIVTFFSLLSYVAFWAVATWRALSLEHLFKFRFGFLTGNICCRSMTGVF